jgi:uncharacterized membrane protein (DUF485 family)
MPTAHPLATLPALADPMNEDATIGTWLLIALTIAGTILLAIYVHRAPQ